MLRKSHEAAPERPGQGPEGRPSGRLDGRLGGRLASAGLLVAVGTMTGNVLAYGFNLVLSRGLGPQGYAELGTLLTVFLVGSVPGLAVQAVNPRRLAAAAGGPPEAPPASPPPPPIPGRTVRRAVPPG